MRDEYTWLRGVLFEHHQKLSRVDSLNFSFYTRKTRQIKNNKKIRKADGSHFFGLSDNLKVVYITFNVGKRQMHLIKK
jgi:hypothetical protein